MNDKIVKPANIIFKKDTPFSKEFDDIYYSVEDGLKESEYVFLDGNNLDERFSQSDNFTIIETGFGTGLNFFATLKLWIKSARKDSVKIGRAHV